MSILQSPEELRKNAKGSLQLGALTEAGSIGFLMLGAILAGGTNLVPPTQIGAVIGIISGATAFWLTLATALCVNDAKNNFRAAANDETAHRVKPGVPATGIYAAIERFLTRNYNI